MTSHAEGVALPKNTKKPKTNTQTLGKLTRKKRLQSEKPVTIAQPKNSSFNFAWNSAVSTSRGLVLRKKGTVTKKPISDDVAIIKNKPNESRPTETKTTDPIENKRRPVQSNVQQKLIKRKTKKDKQINANKQRETITNKEQQSKTHSLFSEQHKTAVVKPVMGEGVSEKLFGGKNFSDLPIHKHLVSNLAKINFTTLTTVQEKAIPPILTGSNALIRSQTGSGKTLAYAVPIVNALQNLAPRLQRKDGVQAIILVPTRELVIQTEELFAKINTFQWIVVGHLCGGENRKSEKDRLRKGVHIIIGTPGRLLDHVLHTNAFQLSNCKFLILDEADRLLDMGFRKDINRLIDELDKSKTNSTYNPMELFKNKKTTFDDHLQSTDTTNSKTEQRILLSATLTKDVNELANFAIKNHIFIDALDDADGQQTGSAANQNDLIIPHGVNQQYLLTYVKHRLFILSSLIVSASKNSWKMFVFMASTHMVEFHYDLFKNFLLNLPRARGKFKNDHPLLDDTDSDEDEEAVLDIEIFKLHGNMEHAKRKEVFSAFRNIKKGVLLCTDVAARGLDVPSADYIVQYNGPQTDEDYLHRVGRTGRAGQTGNALIFLTHEEQQYVNELAQHKVFLKPCNADVFLRNLCDVMEEPDQQQAGEALQRRYEQVLKENKELHRKACLAYSSWSSFYNSFPVKMRRIFDFKNINLGHYATSFAIRDTPSHISKVVRGEVAQVETPRLNKKLDTHADPERKYIQPKNNNKRPQAKKPTNTSMSEFASGLEPPKKKLKRNKK